MKDSHKKIKSLFYIVSIICMIITLFGRVHAEGLPDYALSYLDNTNLAIYIDNTTESSLISAYADALDMPYFVYCKGNRNTSYYETYVFCDHDGIGFLRTSISSNRYEFPAYLNNSTGIWTNITSSFDVNCIVFNIYVSGNIRMNYCARRTYHFNSGSGDRNSASWTNTYVYGSTSQGGNPVYNYPSFDSSSKVSIGSFYGINSNSSGGPYFYINDLYDTVYDDNFTIYKSYGVGGISDPLLNIQYLDNIFSQGYTYTYSTTYDLVFNVDNASINISINSSAFPDDFFENGSFRTSFDLIYRMLSNRILNFNNANNVVLTSVSMSATAYPTADHQGTPETVTKSTLCNLVLKGSSGTDAESENIPAITDRTIVFDQVANSGDFFNHTGVWHNDVNMPDWAELYQVCIYDDYELLLSEVVDAGFNADWTIEKSALDRFKFKGFVDPTFVSINNAQVDDYNNLDLIKDNINRLTMFENITKYADILRIWVVNGDGNGDPFISGDYVFYTYNYYNKLTIKGIGNVQSAVESGTYYTKSLYWYLKERLDNMSGYLVPYINESKNNQIIQNGYLQSINTNVLTIKDSIESGVNSIVSAISGISGGSSYSLPSLSTELQRLFIPSFTWQSIDFEEYMDSMGVLSLPFTFTNDVLTIADNSYSPTLDLHINDFALDVTGNNDVLTIFEDQNYSFNPRSIFANSAWTMLTYLNAFALILGEAWITYCHIFRREKSNDC